MPLTQPSTWSWSFFGHHFRSSTTPQGGTSASYGFLEDVEAGTVHEDDSSSTTLTARRWWCSEGTEGCNPSGPPPSSSYHDPYERSDDAARASSSSPSTGLPVQIAVQGLVDRQPMAAHTHVASPPSRFPYLSFCAVRRVFVLSRHQVATSDLTPHYEMEQALSTGMSHYPSPPASPTGSFTSSTRRAIHDSDVGIIVAVGDRNSPNLVIPHPSRLANNPSPTPADGNHPAASLQHDPSSLSQVIPWFFSLLSGLTFDIVLSGVKSTLPLYMPWAGCSRHRAHKVQLYVVLTMFGMFLSAPWMGTSLNRHGFNVTSACLLAWCLRLRTPASDLEDLDYAQEFMTLTAIAYVGLVPAANLDIYALFKK